MKRMLLVSMFGNVSEMLKDIEPNLAGQTVTYIPTAIKVEAPDISTEIFKRPLEELGLTVEELDVSTASLETIKQTLEKNELIYIGGGNTFYLLQELRRSGADQLLIQEVNNGKLYIGESAGAIVVSPNIGYSAVMDSVEKAPDLKDYTGLNLIDFYVVPHCKNPEMGEAADEIIETYFSIFQLKEITDDQAVLVEGDKVRVLGK
ncbi:Type 1 glutamine amidotransferase-like domain-containing protein [Enterococcus sp. 669A]|uniref:Type 1 glutamine amidotransferase-like domain-containing protein n=1 Tax=Candidatus Enterococcus moelleringii TaxID=2815325 RepID=A0ABS3LBN2_9ENTE|nr:Type 1 glutamine amidotransferase-like domain-containing protein [Enterococcus sp. 669A]MBO1307034.1 Type 1 glutamine amidotransferase-like domain-containing protein [Enterococcus sp. 669A]